MSDTPDFRYMALRPIQDNIDPTMELWRYIRLSALFSLLEFNRIYVPSLAELKAGDPLEATIMCPKTRASFDTLLPDDEDAKWLRERIPVDQRGQAGRVLYDNNLSTIWLRELAKRRAVWCWHSGTIESMAMWHIYGKEGVAIKTTPRRIDECLFAQLGCVPASIGEIDYSGDRSDDQTTENTRYRRPYFVKFAGYTHEKEVRVVFATPNGADGRGLLLEINGGQLIEKIVISPIIPEVEAFAVQRAIKRCLGEETHIQVEVSSSRTSWPQDHQDIRERASKRFPHAPMFGHDDPPCLRGDLREYNGAQQG